MISRPRGLARGFNSQKDADFNPSLFVNISENVEIMDWVCDLSRWLSLPHYHKTNHLKASGALVGHLTGSMIIYVWTKPYSGD